MRNRFLLWTLVFGVGVFVAATQPRPAVGADDDQDRVGQLIKQLGSPKFAVRDRAKKELETMGTAALEALRKAAKSDDMETSRRAGELVKKFEEKIAIDNLLAPKKVQLSLKDVSVVDAINELSKQSGYPIHIDGDRVALSKRLITLETGETTFWQAFDQLCQKGNLVDVTNTFNQFNTPIYRGGLQPVPQPLPAVMPNPPQRIIIQPLMPPMGQPGVLPALPNLQDKNAKEMVERMQKVLEQLRKELEKEGKLQLPMIQPGLQLKAPNQLPARQQLEKEMQKAQQEMQQLLQKMLEQMQKENPQLPALPQLPPLKLQNGGLFQQNNAQPVQVQVQQVQVKVGNAQLKQLPPVPAPPVQAQPVPQAPVAQVKPAIQPIGGRRPIINNNVINNGQITVRDGKPEQYPTSYAGAVRVRVVPMSQQGVPVAAKQAGEVMFVLEATGEPRMQGFSVIGNAMIDRAIDTMGQSLFVTMNDPQMDNGVIVQPNGVRIMRGGVYHPYNMVQRYVVVRLKAGEKESRTLKELKGTLTAQMLSAPEALITFDNLLKAAGKDAKGPNGGKVEIVAVEKLNSGDVKVQIRLENVQNVNGAFNTVNVRVPSGGGFNTSQGMATVRDAKGKDYQFVGSNFHATRIVNGVINQEMTLTYRPNGAEEPAALVFNGHRMLTMQVPFSFTNVPLE